MGLVGIEKDRYNFVAPRIEEQLNFWPEFVKQWDKDQEGKRFRSEILSLTDLWNLYLGYMDEMSDAVEVEEDGSIKPKTQVVKKPKKGIAVVPIKAFELPGRFNRKGVHHKGENGYLYFDQWLYARDQARKELFFLCKSVGLTPRVDYRVHKTVCDQFVQPDFDGVYSEGYTLEDFTNAVAKQNRVPKVWVGTKEYEKNTLDDFGHYILDPVQSEKNTNYARSMLLLDPRGFFKTWIDVANVVQLLINAPDARIMLMSGVYKMTAEFLGFVKSKLYLPESQEPSVFNLLFPEFVIRGSEGYSKEGLRIKQSCPFLGSRLHHDPAGATVGIISIGSSLSGNHCEFLKFDDIVTDENCNTPETRLSLKEKADGAVNLMMEWSWHDIIGTRYFPDDYYGIMLDNFEKNKEDFNLKYFQRAAWVVKNGYDDLEETNIFKIEESMVELAWPEHRSFRTLRKMLLENELKFRCQQLNQPVWNDGNTLNFDRNILELQKDKSTAEVVGADGTIFGAIDLAKENKQFSDYTAIAVGKVYLEKPKTIPVTGQPYAPEDQGSYILVVLDVQFGKWSQTETANRIAAMHDKWRPKQWSGEDTGGLELLKSKIVDVSKTTYGHWPYIRWESPDNSDNAKKNRIKGVEMLLRSKRLHFLLSPSQSWEEVFGELEKYKGQKSSRYFKDDVPDVLGQLSKFVPNLVRLSRLEMEQQAILNREEYDRQLRWAQHDTIFGSRGGFPSMPDPNLQYEPTTETSNSPMNDIARRVFGGNGMRG